MFDTIIVGGGPAGMFAAGTAAQNGENVCLVEKNEKLGKKLFLTGKGRCNLTNNCSIDTLMENVRTNSRFLYSAFSAFMPEDTINFFESRGVPLKTERGKRVFPLSDKSSDIIKALQDYSKSAKLINADVTDLIIENNQIKGVVASNRLYSKKVILATGGLSYPKTGSDGFGLELAKRAGHTIIPPKPSLVPLTSDDEICKECQGLSLKNVKIELLTQNNLLYKDFGEMLFTHFGLSGPIILSSSAHYKQGCYISVDFKPALDEQKLEARILRDIEESKNKNLNNLLSGLLPAAAVNSFILKLKFPNDLKAHSITKGQRKEITALLKNYAINLTGTRPIEEAVITSGGVKVSEINPKTMESKLVRGLHFAGEMIDVDAYTGGFNIQIALSTGYTAGVSSN